MFASRMIELATMIAPLKVDKERHHRSFSKNSSVSSSANLFFRISSSLFVSTCAQSLLVPHLCFMRFTIIQAMPQFTYCHHVQHHHLQIFFLTVNIGLMRIGISNLRSLSPGAAPISWCPPTPLFLSLNCVSFQAPPPSRLDSSSENSDGLTKAKHFIRFLAPLRRP